MTRDQMMAVIQQAYTARARGDVKAIIEAFTPDATFALNAAPPQACLAVDTRGCDGLHAALRALVDAFEFQKLDIVDTIIEGSKAVVRIHLTVRSRATGRTAVTEALDLLEFRDGKIASYTQFLDTATADGLIAKSAFAS